MLLCCLGLGLVACLMAALIAYANLARRAALQAMPEGQRLECRVEELSHMQAW